MARDFKRAAAADDAEQAGQIDNGQCVAHGCLMPGSISHSVHGSKTWVCHMHFRTSIDNWQRLTERIRQHSLLVNLIREVRQSQNGKLFEIKGWSARLDHAGLMEYAPSDCDRGKSLGKLSPRRWLERLEKTLYGLVMAGMDHEADQSGQFGNADMVMDEIDKFLKKHRLGADVEVQVPGNSEAVERSPGTEG